MGDYVGAEWQLMCIFFTLLFPWTSAQSTAAPILTNSAISNDNMGMTFVISFYDLTYFTSVDPFAPHNPELYFTTLSSNPVTVSVTVPNIPTLFLTTVTVIRGQRTIVSLPAAVRISASGISNAVIYIVASDKIAVQAINKEQYNIEASTIYPTNTFGQTYYAVTWPVYYAYILVIAASPGTTIVKVQLAAAASYSGVNYVKGSVVTVNLQQYQAMYMPQTSNTNLDLTGSLITASNPVLAMSGDTQTSIGTVDQSYIGGYAFYAHVMEQLVPVEAWGTNFALDGTPDRVSGDKIVIVGSVASTSITFSNGVTGTVNAGTFSTWNFPMGTIVIINATHPVELYIFSENSAFGEIMGAPTLTYIPPTNLYRSQYSFSTMIDITDTFTLTAEIICPITYESTLMWNGVSFSSAFPTATWTNFPQEGYAVASIFTSDGAFDVYNTVPNAKFLITISALSPGGSYDTLAGSYRTFINKPCNRTATVPDDGFDNDCDLRVDEELYDSIDNDGDGLIDEDLAPLPRVDGSWGAWSNWSQCDCNTSPVKTRTRLCNNPSPQGYGFYCPGFSNDNYTCCCNGYPTAAITTTGPIVTAPTTPTPINTEVAGMDNTGTEFLMSFFDVAYYTVLDSTAPHQPTLYFTTLSNIPVQVNVSIPLVPSLNYWSSVTVVRGQQTVVQVPVDVRLTTDGVNDASILIQASANIAVQAMINEMDNLEGLTVYPTRMLTANYYVMLAPYYYPCVLIVAASPGTTTVNVLVTATISYSGTKYRSGSTITETLQQYEIMFILDQSGNTVELTGSKITASQPVAVFAGDTDAVVPTSYGYSNPVFEQMMPVETWGNNFAVYSTPDRTTGDIIKIVGSVANTVITVQPGTTSTIGAGTFTVVTVVPGAIYIINATHPVLVHLFSEAEATSEHVGDPTMAYIAPINQYRSQYVFSIMLGAIDNLITYAVVVIKANKESTLIWNGQPFSIAFPQAIWQSFSVEGYATTSVLLSNGAQDVYSTDPTCQFSITLHGLSNLASYAINVGSNAAFINQVCTSTTTTPDDGHDNDCDGRIDEELANGIDDDGDGRTDEDLSPIARIDGGWSAWSSFTPCSCAVSPLQYQYRTCNNPAPVGYGLYCQGNNSNSNDCGCGITTTPIVCPSSTTTPPTTLTTPTTTPTITTTLATSTTTTSMLTTPSTSTTPTPTTTMPTTPTTPTPTTILPTTPTPTTPTLTTTTGTFTTTSSITTASPPAITPSTTLVTSLATTTTTTTASTGLTTATTPQASTVTTTQPSITANTSSLPGVIAPRHGSSTVILAIIIVTCISCGLCSIGLIATILYRRCRRKLP